MDQEKYQFQKEIKLKPLLIILSLFSFHVSSESSIEKFNNLIDKDLSFVQKSLDPISNEYIESAGTLIHQDALIIVNIETPYKEKYTINNTFIDVYDYDFEQSRVIQLDDIDTNMIHYIKISTLIICLYELYVKL